MRRCVRRSMGLCKEKLVSPGAYLKENTPILTLMKTDPLRLRVDLPESAAGAVRVGTSLTFTTGAAPAGTFTAVVRELNPSLDPQSRTLTVEARLPRGDARLRPGMFVQVQLVAQKGAEAVVVPKEAVYSVAGLTKLFVIRDGRAVEQRINPGQEWDGWMEVPRDVLKPGDRVATSALTQLVTGTPVRRAARLLQRLPRSKVNANPKETDVMQKLAEICIRRPVFATMLIMALVVLGMDSYRKLGVDLFPKIDLPVVTVTTTLRGAAPEEVETQISKRIEEAVNTISGIDDLRSTSAEGISIVAVQFMLDKDPEVGAQEIRDKINRILPDLPQDADPPVIEKVATDASPILNVAVSSPRDLRETTKIVDDKIKKSIESLAGVGQVRFVGERQRQVQVWLDGEKLYSYNLNVEQIRAALAAQNVEVPGGRVDQGARELSLRTMGRVTNPQDFERIVIGNAGGRPIRISRCRSRRGWVRRTTFARAIERNACGRARSSKAGRHEHAGRDQLHQNADRRAAEARCLRILRSRIRATSRNSFRTRSMRCRST